MLALSQLNLCVVSYLPQPQTCTTHTCKPKQHNTPTLTTHNTNRLQQTPSSHSTLQRLRVWRTCPLWCSACPPRTSATCCRCALCGWGGLDLLVWVGLILLV